MRVREIMSVNILFYYTLVTIRIFTIFIPENNLVSYHYYSLCETLKWLKVEGSRNSILIEKKFYYALVTRNFYF